MYDASLNILTLSTLVLYLDIVTQTDSRNACSIIQNIVKTVS